MRPASGPGDFMIVIPAFNEEGAIGGVVREIHAVVPGAPVLVIDDCSNDATKHVATAAALNLVRCLAWFNGVPRAQTRRSTFARLYDLA